MSLSIARSLFLFLVLSSFNMQRAQSGVVTASVSLFTDFKQGVPVGLVWGAGWFVAYKWLFTDPFKIRAAMWLAILSEHADEDTDIMYESLLGKFPEMDQDVLYAISSKIIAKRHQVTRGHEPVLISLTKEEVLESFELYNLENAQKDINTLVDLLN